MTAVTPDGISRLIPVNRIPLDQFRLTSVSDHNGNSECTLLVDMIIRTD